MDLTSKTGATTHGAQESWRYPRFFTDSNLTLSDDDLRHARTVLRFKQGDKLILCDGNGVDYICEWCTDGKPLVLQSQANRAEPNLKVRLFQCLPKSDKFDFIVQKAVELGVSEIVPVISARCVSRPDRKAMTNKVTRWNKIAYEAAKQCGRGKIPTVSDSVSFKQAVERFNSDYVGILFYECGGSPLNEVLSNTNKAHNIDIFIGSEGGFDSSEVELAKAHGLVPTTLGSRILRVDTACIAAISIIMNLTGNI